MPADGSGVPVLTVSFSIDSDFHIPWSAALKTAVRYALDQWSAVANITFQEVDSNSITEASTADIALTPTGTHLAQSFFGAVGLGVFPDPDFFVQRSFFPATGGNRSQYAAGPEGDIYLDNGRPEMLALNPGGSGIEVILHELGHALGLKHPQDSQGDYIHPGDPQIPFPSIDPHTRLTLMSGGAVDLPLASGHPVTPLLYDIAAIQHIYGANMSYRTGDDTYTLKADGTVRAIWDAGGIDTVDLSAVKAPLVVTLEEGSWTQVSANSGFAIAFDVTIENAIGGAGSDALIGNGVSNRLEGRDGDDTLDGAAGGTDTLVGGAGNDTYEVRNPGDVVVENAGAGDDQILGFVPFIAMPDNVERLFVQTAALDATVIGNASSNLIVGAGSVDNLQGGAGNDTLDAGSLGQPDTLAGGPGDDVYRNGDPDLFVELPGQGTDTVETILATVLRPNFENLTLLGSANVNGTGNAEANVLRGNAGDNVLDGKGGADTLIGGDGNDSYALDPCDVVIDSGGHDAAIATMSLLAMPAGLDDVSVTSIAGNAVIGGSGGANHLVGNYAANVLSGGDGGDWLEGGKGDDFLFGGNGNDTLDGGRGADVMDGGAGFDTYIVDSTHDRIVESALGGLDTAKVFAARYTMDANVEVAEIDRGTGAIVAGNSLANAIISGAGADTLTGGAGADSFHFRDLLAVDHVLDFEHGVDKLVLEGGDFAGASLGGSLHYDDSDGMLSMNGTDFLQLGVAFHHPALDELTPSDIVVI